MNTKFSFLISATIAVVCSTAAMAQNKFLAPVAEEKQVATSCSAPTGKIAIVTNILPKDVYLARTGPSSEGDYRFSVYTFESRAFLTQDFMITSDPATAEVCVELEQGNVTEELQRRFDDAIQSDLLWWPVEADKDLGYPHRRTSSDQVSTVGYISAKHISFVTSEEWAAKVAPNPLGYLALGGKILSVPIPIISMTGMDTDFAKAVAAGTTSYAKDALHYCMYGYSISDLTRLFSILSEQNIDVPYYDISLPSNQTDILIENGVWSGCRVRDEDVLEDFLGLEVGQTIEVVANCPASLIVREYGDSEINVSVLNNDLFYGGMGAIFATLCPAMTEQILQADCDAGNDYSCYNLAEFIER